MREGGTFQSFFHYDPLSLGQEVAEYDGTYPNLGAGDVQRIYLRLPEPRAKARKP